MSSELIINSSRDKSRIGLLKDKKLVEFHQESDETKFNVGDIYVGKVKKINKSLNAAFIDIGFEGFDYANPLIEALDQEIESDLFIMID